MGDVTLMLEAVQRGDARAAEELLAAVYGELRRIAAWRMAQEAPGHTLQPTALVHEAWLRLAGDGVPRFEGRAHFFAAAAEAMRRILIDAARRKRSLKRGGEAEHVELDEGLVMEAPAADAVLALDEALEILARRKPDAATLVKLRYFVGMTMEEAAEAMDMPLRSAGRLWTYARAWLRQRLQRDLEGGGPQAGDRSLRPD